MRIGLIAPLQYPIGEPFHGGLEMHTHLLARELQDRGHEVTIFGHPESDERFRVSPFCMPMEVGLGQKSHAYYKLMMAVRKWDFDVVHDNSIHFVPPLQARTLACPVITTLHTPPYRSFKLTSRLTRKTPNHKYVAISNFISKQWEPYVGKSEVVHNGLDLTDWSFSAMAEPKTAIWYGRFTPEKGAEYAIRAARAAGYRLQLAGPVYDMGYFQRKVEPLLGDGIEYIGHKTQSELAELVGKAAVGLVTPVWDEPFGLAYAEMLACGTPVAGFDSGAASEIVTPECGTLVPKRDVAALTRVLGEVEKGIDRAKCRERVESYFRVAGMIEGYLNIYDSARLRINTSAQPHS